MKVIILAAGRGKRLGKITENDPKVMAQACDKPLIDHVINSVSFVEHKDIHIVVGYKKESVMSHLGDEFTYSVQDLQLGTGHAVRCAREAFMDYDGDVLIAYGDMPLVRKESYLALIEEHKKNNSLCTLMTADVTPIPPWGRIIRDENGYIVDFETTGDFPKFGNDDDRVDLIAKETAHKVITELRKTPTYRDAEHTLSVLTITSNVMYGKNTGATPDGRKASAPFAPGANPMHNREENGALASLNSVAKISYDDCRDGVSNTFSITPEALGRTPDERVGNLVTILDGYFAKGAHHINVNVMNRETLMKAYENPEAYPNLTIRVSGYAVNFNKLSREQQREVISRTFHETI